MDLEGVIAEAAGMLRLGKSSSRQAASRESVRVYWDVGRLLAAHLEESGGRADYGEKVVARLGEVSGYRLRQIYEFVDFARKFSIVPSRAQLSWSHYRRLLAVGTMARRHFYVREAARLGWSVKELEAAVAKDAFTEAREAAVGRSGEWIVGRRGDLYTYKVADMPSGSGRIAIDLGFGITRSEVWDKEDAPTRGHVVESRQQGGRGAGGRGEYFLERVDGRTVRPYSYRAVVTDVVDGDTVWVEIDHGFYTTTRRKLRFRGIDAPELWTKAGEIAKSFVKEIVDAVDFMVVHTRRPDKYGRYLADLYYGIGVEDATAVAREGRYLNGEMVRRGFATTA